MRNLLSIAIISGAATLASPALAAEPECTEASARPTTIDGLVAKRVQGECVTVSGIAWRGSLYADVPGIYTTRRGVPGKRISIRALRADPRAPIEVPPDMTAGEFALQSEQWEGFDVLPRRVTMVGKMGRCRTGAVAGGEPDRLIGYKPDPDCRGADGGLLFGTATRVEAFPVTRLTRGDATPDMVGLSPLAADSVWTPRFAAAADEVFAALASGETKRWQERFGGQWMPANDRARIEAILRDKSMPFHDVLQSKRPARAIFGWHFYGPPSATDIAASETDKDAEALVCWSARPDAAKLWPIAAFDADNAPGRPYACVRIAYSVQYEKPSWRASIEEPASGLPERRR